MHDEGPLLGSAAGPLSAGPVRILSHRRSHSVVSVMRALGQDERPELRVDWPAYPLVDLDRGRVGLVQGTYATETHTLTGPRYATVDFTAGLAASSELAELFRAQEVYRSRLPLLWCRGGSLWFQDLLKIGVLPGPRALKALLDQLTPGSGDVRPELHFALMLMLRRRPELLHDQGSHIRTKVTQALARMETEDRRRHAAEVAHAQWAVLGDRGGALDALACWEPPEERVQANYLGVDGRALPLDLMFEFLATADLGAELARGLVKHHMLDPAANALDLGAAVPLPVAFTTGLPELAEAWVALGRTAPREALTRGLVAQFDGWTRVGPILVLATACADVDRMPTVGLPQPDPTGVSVTIHVINDSFVAQSFGVDVPAVSWRGASSAPAPALAAEPIEIPPMVVKTIELGPIDDEPLEPGAPFDVMLPIRVGRSDHRFSLRGSVGVTW